MSASKSIVFFLAQPHNGKRKYWLADRSRLERCVNSNCRAFFCRSNSETPRPGDLKILDDRDADPRSVQFVHPLAERTYAASRRARGAPWSQIGNGTIDACAMLH